MEAHGTSLGHDEARAMFAQWVDDDLTPPEQAALRTHLERCGDCKAGLERYERAVSLVRSVGRERAPADLAALVLKRVQKRRRGLWPGRAGGRVLENVSLPVEVAIPVLLAAVIAALILFFAP